MSNLPFDTGFAPPKATARGKVFTVLFGVPRRAAQVSAIGFEVHRLFFQKGKTFFVHCPMVGRTLLVAPKNPDLLK